MSREDVAEFNECEFLFQKINPNLCGIDVEVVLIESLRLSAKYSIRLFPRQCYSALQFLNKGTSI